ncbi:MAG: family 43 glycosylhydrolase [Lachnospiraceae bacterium]|nr:family 43 glycosylhydrolase [Lachnospiraceae bacterium]
MYLLSYTRQPIDNIYYDPRLAYSMHLAVSTDMKHFKALNHNSGILFGKATENHDGSLNPKALRKPYILNKGKHFEIIVLRTGGDGESDPEIDDNIKAILEDGDVGNTESAYTPIKYYTEDFLVFSEPEIISPEEYVEAMSKVSLSCIWTELSEQRFSGCDEIEGAVPCCVIEIDDEIGDRLIKKLTTPVNTGISFPEIISVSNYEELKEYRAVASYSDGTTALKSIDWNIERVDFEKKGEYILSGRIHQEHFDFPVALNRADPCVTFWNGKYYFIATNDADGNHTLYIRESDTLSGLVDADEKLILDSSTYEEIGGLLWAPEFHEIKGRLYIFHACTPGEFFREESHVMVLKENGNPIEKADWSEPRRVKLKDGSDICEAGKEITLDMTVFEWQDEFYAVWSQRQFLPKDLGAWLYIAKIDPDKPWTLASDPVILSKPDYGWANNHTFVDEGPFALPAEDRLFLTFSSAAVDTSYVVGLLQIEKGRDLLDRKNWRKTAYPILTSRSIPGEFGTGHNAYFKDVDGTIWNTYHARPGADAPRSSGIRRVHFDIDGEPVLDMTEDMDVNPVLSIVKTKLTVV